MIRTYGGSPFHLRSIANELARKTAVYRIVIPDIHALGNTAPHDLE